MSDRRLRRLERAFHEAGTRESESVYLSACLAAGVRPKGGGAPLPLDSPAWSDLTWGHGADIGVLRNQLKQARTRLEGGSRTDPWQELGTLLMDGNGWFESSALALAPHMLELHWATSRSTASSRGIVEFVGDLECTNVDRTGVTPQIACAYAWAVSEARMLSLEAVSGPEKHAFPAYLLQSFAALRHPDLVATTAPPLLAGGELEVTGPCPDCSRPICLYYGSGDRGTRGGRTRARLHLRTGRQLGGSLPAPANPKTFRARLESGEAILDSSSVPTWIAIDTADVLAALARRIPGAHHLSERLLTAFAPFECPHCDQRIDPRSRRRASPPGAS